MSQVQVTRGHGLLEEFLARQRIKVANSLIPPSARRGRLLDIGCGSYPLFLIETEFNEKFGLDKLVDEGKISNLKQQRINLINFDGERQAKFPFEDNYFDVVTMLAVFEHIEPAYIINILKEVRRILKPGGAYIMTTPAVWADGLLRVMAKVGLVSSAEIDEHKDAYTHKKLAFLFQQADFSVEHMSFGYFELFMNIWAKVEKSA